MPPTGRRILKVAHCGSAYDDRPCFAIGSPQILGLPAVMGQDSCPPWAAAACTRVARLLETEQRPAVLAALFAAQTAGGIGTSRSPSSAMSAYCAAVDSGLKFVCAGPIARLGGGQRFSWSAPGPAMPAGSSGQACSWLSRTASRST